MDLDIILDQYTQKSKKEFIERINLLVVANKYLNLLLNNNII